MAPRTLGRGLEAPAGIFSWSLRPGKSYVAIVEQGPCAFKWQALYVVHKPSVVYPGGEVGT